VSGSKAVKERIEQLIAQAPPLSQDIRDISQEFEHYQRQMAWVIAAQHAVQLVCPSEANPYHAHTKSVVAEPVRATFKVSQVSLLLVRLLEEIEGGLLTTIENHAIAVTFDDFLDHGAEYLKRRRKDEAAVIAGIVFEDTIRQICRVLDVSENGVALDTLISELAKRDVLKAPKAKRARAAAGLRTSAAHARWEEIQLSDVKPVIDFTRELTVEHLG
jgi:hypothetical protein